eukprot:7648041-Alexandrium_andersonii.AAC.1
MCIRDRKLLQAERNRPAQGQQWVHWDPKKGAKDAQGAFIEPRWEAHAVLAGMYQREGGRLAAPQGLRT